MGYMRSHAIVVESWNNEMLIAAHNFAASLFPWVSPISPPRLNAIRSFFVPGDGSKEGWTESLEGDQRRAEFKEHLKNLTTMGKRPGRRSQNSLKRTK
jgi:hypothetical protein